PEQTAAVVAWLAMLKGTAPAATGPAAAADAPLPRLPGYEVLGYLGHGGRGVVYRARQLSLGRGVAVQVIKEGFENVAALALFRREAEVVARLQHPNIVQIHDFGEHEGRPYFSMELIQGGSLEDQFAGGPLPARAAAELADTLARTLHAVHHRGVVHRD